MSGRQVAALILGIILLLPGGCFLVASISLGQAGGWVLALIGIAIVYGMLRLFQFAFHKSSAPLSTEQIVVLIFAVILVIASGYLVFAAVFATSNEYRAELAIAASLLLAVVCLILWDAFRKRPAPPDARGR